MTIVYSTDPTVQTTRSSRQIFSWDTPQRLAPVARKIKAKPLWKSETKPAPTKVQVTRRQAPIVSEQPFVSAKVPEQSPLNEYQIIAKRLDAEAKAYADKLSNEGFSSGMVVFGD